MKTFITLSTVALALLVSTSLASPQVQRRATLNCRNVTDSTTVDAAPVSSTVLLSTAISAAASSSSTDLTSAPFLNTTSTIVCNTRPTGKSSGKGGSGKGSSKSSGSGSGSSGSGSGSGSSDSGSEGSTDPASGASGSPGSGSGSSGTVNPTGGNSGSTNTGSGSSSSGNGGSTGVDTGSGSSDSSTTITSASGSTETGTAQSGGRGGRGGRRGGKGHGGKGHGHGHGSTGGGQTGTGSGSGSGSGTSDPPPFSNSTTGTSDPPPFSNSTTGTSDPPPFSNSTTGASNTTLSSNTTTSSNSSDLLLLSANVQTGSESDGLNANSTAKGQSASQTDDANFINFCSGKTLTNGLQVKEGSCNGIVMGDLPANTDMISHIITFPGPGSTSGLQSNTTFNITLKVLNLVPGTFTNPTTTYYGAPQELSGGKVIGHTHVTVQSLGTSLAALTPPDPATFAFFKGINDAGDGNGGLSATVAGGLPPGAYRVCTMGSASNHQPVLMPVAQRGAQDDCQKFTVK